jgi:hypothetical protein
MNAKDILRTAFDQNHYVLTMYLSDLSDADLLVRPVPGANPVAWQLGHIIASEAAYFLPQMPGAKPVELPAGFAERHDRDKAGSEATAGYATKAEYLALFSKVREATKAALAKLSEEDLDKPTTGPLAKMACSVASSASRY